MTGIRGLASAPLARRITAYGACSSLPNAPEKVPSLNPQQSFKLGGGNWSLCPVADPSQRHEHSNRTTKWGQSREWQGPTPKLGFVRRN